MNFFRTIFKLSTGFQGYRAIRDQPVVVSLLYLGQLVALLALVLLLALLPLALEWNQTAALWMDGHLPKFSVRNEHVVTEVAQPARAGNDAFRFILDTTGQVTAPETNAERGVLVTSDEFLVWYQSGGGSNANLQTRRQSWRGFPDGVVNGDYFRKLTRTFAWVGVPLCYLVMAVGGMVLVLVQALFFSLVGSFVERNTPRPLSLTQHLNIAIHAVTPAALIVTAYLALRMWAMDFWLIYLVAYGVALIGASNACRDKTPPKQNEDLF
jgi:hypothetical protein